MTEKEYGKLIKSMAPKSPVWKDSFNAFWIGGLICTIGQLILNGYSALGLDKTDAGTATSITLVALSAPAVEFKTEGFILGVGAKMFTIAGPVIVYGVSASVVYGLIYWITTLF